MFEAWILISITIVVGLICTTRELLRSDML